MPPIVATTFGAAGTEVTTLGVGAAGQSGTYANAQGITALWNKVTGANAPPSSAQQAVIQEAGEIQHQIFESSQAHGDPAKAIAGLGSDYAQVSAAVKTYQDIVAKRAANPGSVSDDVFQKSAGELSTILQHLSPAQRDKLKAELGKSTAPAAPPTATTPAPAQAPVEYNMQADSVPRTDILKPAQAPVEYNIGADAVPGTAIPDKPMAAGNRVQEEAAVGTIKRTVADGISGIGTFLGQAFAPAIPGTAPTSVPAPNERPVVAPVSAPATGVQTPAAAVPLATAPAIPQVKPDQKEQAVVPPSNTAAPVAVPTDDAIVHFDTNKADIRAGEDADKLEGVTKKIEDEVKTNGTADVTIDTGCDTRGTRDLNNRLGNDRAQSIDQEIEAKLKRDGIDISKVHFSLKPHGKDHAFLKKETAENVDEQENRYGEIKVEHGHPTATAPSLAAAPSM